MDKFTSINLKSAGILILNIMSSINKHLIESTRQLFIRNGGILRTNQALALGIHPRTLYQMRDSGVITSISRGLYRLIDLPDLGNPDFVAIAVKIPKGVVCLLSALAFHELTTQIPHFVYVALARGSELPRLSHPPIKILWFSANAFQEGIEEHRIDKVPVKIYSKEKTIADCFKYRNKLGLDTALHALRVYRKDRNFDVNKLLYFARVCRVERVMRGYLEAMV